MTHVSPAAHLVWAVQATLLGVFLLFHLWSFDRFKCLRWSSGSSGAFKRVMTYSYLLTIPLLASYSFTFGIIKYNEGFIALPKYGIIPKPHQLWSPLAQRAIFPVMITFSIGWAFEMVTHLEELCFWLFLVNASSSQQNWFNSMYFKSWVVGSVIAVIYMPLVAVFTRSDPLKNEAYVFLAGSLGDLSLTIWFTPILWMFPAFLQNLKSEGVDMSTMVRLTKFCELNNIRVIFRFLFAAPLLLLAIDGVRPHQHINENMFATDFLAIVAGFGATISSALTLVIFFPRSIQGEMADREASVQRKRARSYGNTETFDESRYQTQTNMSQSIHANYQPSQHYNAGKPGTYHVTSSPMKRNFSKLSDGGDVLADDIEARGAQHSHSTDKHWDESEEGPTDLGPIRPNRRKGNEIQLGGIEARLTEHNLSQHNLKASNVNPLVHNFTSPINLVESGVAMHRNDSGLTFKR